MPLTREQLDEWAKRKDTHSLEMANTCHPGERRWIIDYDKGLLILRCACCRRVVMEIEVATGASNGRARATGPPTMRCIANEAAMFYDIPLDEMLGPSRHKRLAHARQLAMLLTRIHTRHSLEEIGKFFHRDHTTVIHACKAAERRLVDDGRTAKDAEAIAHRFTVVAQAPEREEANG